MSNIDTVGDVVANVHLPPELEAFARHCVEGGNMSEVVRVGLRMLQSASDR